MSAEIGSSDFTLLPNAVNAKVTGIHESLQQESEKDALWYRDVFLGKRTFFKKAYFQAHQNFLAVDSPRGPLAVSLIKDGKTYKALVRSGQGNEKYAIEESAVTISWWRALFDFGPSLSSIFSALSFTIPIQGLVSVKSLELPTDLLAMEERQIIRSYKFGVMYLSGGQSTENQAMSNSHGMPCVEMAHFSRRRRIGSLQKVFEVSGRGN